MIKWLEHIDTVEKGKATHSRILAWRIPRTVESMGMQRVGHGWTTFAFTSHIDNHDGVITLLEPNILECKVKRALGSIAMNKANGGDGILVELFQIPKDDAVKVLHSLCQQIWKTQLLPQDWKRPVFIPIPKKGNAKECSNYRKLHSSHMLVK